MQSHSRSLWCRKTLWVCTIVVFFVVWCEWLYAENTLPYKCEIGVLGGCGYVLGETNRFVFQGAREVYGLQFRYKFAPRGALQTKIYGMRVTGDEYEEDLSTRTGERWTNQMFCWDVTGEFNFFRFGDKRYDLRYKVVTPYMYVGVGMAIHSGGKVCAYVPFGIGVKWRFKKRYGLNMAWQHELFFADNLENNDPRYNDTHNMNGGNFFNFDTGGCLTLGFVVEFRREKPICRTCDR